jgi:hypothetical protein
MNNVTNIRPINMSAGSTNGAVSSQWFNRPDDERFLDLDSLEESVLARKQASRADVVDSNRIEVVAQADKPDDLHLIVPGVDVAVRPTHWSFGQLASLVKAPAGYLRKLPSPIAAINMQFGLVNHRAEKLKSYVSGDQLLAATGPEYGRIFDYEVVRAVRRIAGNGTGDTPWKVPGVIEYNRDFGIGYNPHVDITKQNTTLFASDRDVWLFLVDDTHPIEIGKLPDGSPDLLFRGFYIWNSEVGSKSFGIATMYLRGVCQNRILWGVEGFQEIRFRHSKGAPERFLTEAAPALASFAERDTARLEYGISRARDSIVATDKDKGIEFLNNRSFSRSEAAEIYDTVLREEGHEPRSVWDYVQGITAYARTKGHQDERIATETVAKRILDRVA